MRPHSVIAASFSLAIFVQNSAAQRTPHEEAMQDAVIAWEMGHYPTALDGFIRLLEGPNANQYFEKIALITGELYHTYELTTDGANARVSPDGRYVAYESGNERQITVVDVRNGMKPVATIAGRNIAFAPRTGKLAYLAVGDTPELRAARTAVLRATGERRDTLQQRVVALEARSMRIRVRDLASGKEVELRDGGLVKGGLVWNHDGSVLYFLAMKEGDAMRNDIYSLTETATAPTLVTTEDGFKNLPSVASNGGYLMYVLPFQNPIPALPSFEYVAGGGRGGRGGRGGGGGAAAGGRGAGGAGGAARGAGGGGAAASAAGAGAGAGAGAAAGGGRAGRAGGGGGGGIPQGAQGGAAAFAVRDLRSGDVRRFTGGLFPTMSRDGSRLFWVERAGTENRIRSVATSGGEPVDVKIANGTIANPAISPNGTRIAFQFTPREDSEIYLIGVDGQNEVRLTREIQPDHRPHFLNENLMLATMGEPRHTRSYIYDLRTLERKRLFHNNSVRTIAPEYQWAPSADGTMIVIEADRDGNTISQEHGIYATDLTRTVTRDELLARLRSSLAQERDLRQRGEKMFAPLAEQIRQYTSKSSIAKIYEYEKTLFDFDSKNITRPGNKPAREYLFRTYQSFGYEPEYQFFNQNNAADSGRTANVLATLRGTENPELVYIVSSHFDSHQSGPGADDNTSGTAALLEAARVLAKHPQPATIVFASFTGEESGLLGSREWVRQAVANNVQLVGALNNDMLGWANDHRLDNTIRYSNPGIRDIQHAAAFLFSDMITYDAVYYRSTDAAAYYEQYGDIVGGIGSYPVLGNPHYHTSHDILEVENHRLITEASKTTVATLVLLANSPSRLKDLRVVRSTGNTHDLEWKASPEKSVVSYIVEYVPVGATQRQRLTFPATAAPKATLQNVAPGSEIMVKALNAKGLEGWDWARVAVRQ